METVIKVEGMSCEHCVKAITDAVSALNGVKNVSVDLATKTTTVGYEQNTCNLEEITAAIEDQGFDVVE